MIKLPDWQLRMERLIAQRQSAPFAWGVNDCCTFAADCVTEITGTDPAPVRTHRTEKQALRALKRHGGVIGIATAAMGQPVPSSQAHVGDVVLCQAAGHDMLGICNGTTALAPSAHGLVAVAMGELCWRIA
jgi:hypothetical protein